MARKYRQGFFTPRNPGKYVGDVNNIVFRSSWEYRFLSWCDESPDVVMYTSEEVVIPYFSVTDHKTHRYFVDFLVKIKTSQGERIYLIEIKPFEETQLPKKSRSKYYPTRLETWVKNQEKWKAAANWARENGCEFVVMTEKELFGK